jgi:hypothetical protein
MSKDKLWNTAIGSYAIAVFGFAKVVKVVNLISKPAKKELVQENI